MIVPLFYNFLIQVSVPCCCSIYHIPLGKLDFASETLEQNPQSRSYQILCPRPLALVAPLLFKAVLAEGRQLFPSQFEGLASPEIVSITIL